MELSLGISRLERITVILAKSYRLHLRRIDPTLSTKPV